MWNRTRAIRQDFIVQGLRGALEIECHERIARYHILCLHWKGGVGAEQWSEQQELEQLRKTIRSLTEFYEDLRRSTGKTSLNEAEFRAYSLLLHMQDPETLREVEALPLEVFDSPSVQAALRLRGYAQRSNNVIKRGRPLNTEATMNMWTRFFAEIKNSDQVSYLLACLAENAFSQVRAGAIKAMGKTYLSQHAPLPLSYVRRSLGMDAEEEARLFAVALNCEEVRLAGPESPVTAMRLAKANEDKPLPSAPFSKSIVEVKRCNHSSQDIVDGKLSGAAPLIPISSAPIGPSDANADKIPFLAAQIAPSPAPPSSSSPFPVFFPDGVASTGSSLEFVPPSAPASGSLLSAKAPVFIPSACQPPPKQAEVATTPTLTPPKASFFLQSPLSPAPNQVINSPASSLFTVGSSAPGQEASIGTPATPRKPAPEAASTEAESQPSTTESKDIPKPKKASPRKESAAKSVGVSPARPARTLASVTASLATSLINDFLSHKLSSICQQACLREVRVRRKEVRRRFVLGAQQELYEAMESEAVDDAVAEVASEAIADEFRRRCLERLVVRKRRAAVERVLERRRHSQAWREIEDRVRQLEAIETSSPTKKKRSIDEVVVKNKSNSNNQRSFHQSINKMRRIEPSSRRIPATSVEVESLRAMMAKAAQLLD